MQFLLPYKQISKRIGYAYFEKGQSVQKNNNMAYYVIKGMLRTHENLQIQPDMWYEGEFAFEAQTETHCFMLPLSIYKKFTACHTQMFQQKKKTLISNLPILEKVNYRIQDQLIKGFQEVKFVNKDFVLKMDDPGSSLFILQHGILIVSKTYQKSLSQYEKLVLPKKFWFDDIVLCEFIDKGFIGEEFLSCDKALYNVQVASKTATLLMISIQQLKQISQQVFQAIFKISTDNQFIREEIYKEKCQELEKYWQNTNKSQILSQDIKKTISFKVIQKQSSSQDQQCQTIDDQMQFIIGNLSYKKMPTFIQQYFRQKNIKIKKKQDPLQQLQRSQNSISFHQVDPTIFDSQILIQKVQQKISAQQNQQQSFCLRKSQSRQFNRNKSSSKSEHIKPNASQIVFQFNIPQQQENNKLQNEQKKDQMMNKTIFSNFQTPKPEAKLQIKMKRSTSVIKLNENLSSITPGTQSKTPRENLYINFSSNQIVKKIKVNQLLLNQQF
ncbi:unnamed protein product (macronuclear) [Paramecium tetraurelia]|uniref:Cyclic nucleotide-binding domain-containing protein n=1 Tax=Paramecium tetraurelia TaxID=5888 RepID=A0C5C0_PARTE|nr:uncharacterized protein GSPATT00006486001 [Paramecium tetraurelia]CAK65987.1 unnamed protein product [Paramecium tetraurelia]|eukprot:XP_001433384.1 hypothetical protein (macronuclear) [Paramecium tetraurelia strain d4-2]